MTNPRTQREQNFLDDLNPEQYVIAKRWLGYEGGTMAVAALAIEMHELRRDMQRAWWRTPAQFIGVAGATAIATLASWKGLR